MGSDAHESAIWQLNGKVAELRAPHLQARVDLARPARGLSELNWGANALEGSVMGIAASDRALDDASMVDAFARGDDLVATYGQIDQAPFSLQVYWTVAAGDRGVVTVDAILSLQTPLLESFPGVRIESQLASVAAWIVPRSGNPTQLSTDSKSQQREHPDGILLRATDEPWSYAEMTHPDDRGRWQVESPSARRCVVRRELGGAFLEKGVIRRLRVRGVFLPRKNDLELAAQCLTEFSAAAPPLTV